MTETLSLSDFAFSFPPELVAHEPLVDRSASRLLQRTAGGQITDHIMKDLPRLLPKGTLLLLNDSAVIPSRLLAHLPTGGAVEIFLMRPHLSGQEESDTSQSHSIWWSIGRPFKKLKPGTLLSFSHQNTDEVPVTATVLAQTESQNNGTPQVQLRFNIRPDRFLAEIARIGYIPLPPYIKRVDPLPANQSPDAARYQTVYARADGSVAAPTAGLHFTDELMAALGAAGIELASLTLHVGGGTFLPVRASDISQHEMHSERFLMASTTWSAITRARAEGRPIVAVGTTALRSLVSFMKKAAELPCDPVSLCDQWHETSLFVYPKDREYRFLPPGLSGIITNFHQPESTLYMLICALVGYEQAKSTYEHAFAKHYRLFSYGDASLLWL